MALSDEAGQPDGKCGKLRKALYGTRAAASCWADSCSRILERHGFVRGMSSPCLFHNAKRGLYTLVHGDDFLTTGHPEQLVWLLGVLNKELEIRMERLGRL